MADLLRMTPIAVDIRQAAALLGVSVTTMKSYVVQGQIAAVRLPSARHDGARSRRLLIAVSDLELFVQSSRVTESTP